MANIGVISLGCDKNRVDTEYMLAALEERGHKIVQDETKADVMIVNTCAFLNSARKESIDTVLEAAALKKTGLQKLIVTGCLPQKYRGELEAELHEVDAFLGVRDYGGIADTVDRLMSQTAAEESKAEAVENALQSPQKGVGIQPHSKNVFSASAGAVRTDGAPETALRTDSGTNNAPETALRKDSGDFAASEDFNRKHGESREKLFTRTLTTPPHYAYLRIADGCNNACSYCLIPSIRGSYRSRPEQDILGEASGLVDGGVKELVLVAQDVTRYGTDMGGRALVPLIQKLTQIPGLHLVRLLYCYPEMVSDALIEEIAQNPKVAKYIDIPFQHVHDRILKDMGRAATHKGILALMQKLRQRVPGIAVRSTFIVGFPGETEEEHRALLEFLSAQEIDHAGFFAYSREDGTRAAKLPGQLPQRTKRARLKECAAVQAEVVRRLNRARIGSTLDVICDGIDFDRQCFYGRHQGQCPGVDTVVRFRSPFPIDSGEIYKVKITRAGFDLFGKAIE